MKHFNSWMGVAIVATAAGSAFANDSAYRTAVGVNSAAMQVRDLEGRTRAAGPGRAAALATISAVVSAKVSVDTSLSTGTSNEDHSFLQGRGWTLDVRGDGSWVRFWSESTDSAPVAVEKRLSTDELDVLGRQFIGDVLSDQIVLQSDERLEVWRTAYELVVGAPVNGDVERKVVDNRIVYTRVIGDTVVVGPGSKVSVTFSNDGRVTGFQYDWSAILRSPTTRKSASASVIAARLVEVTKKKHLPATGATMEQFECGYYDLGALVPSSSALEAGCMAKHVVRNSGLVQSLISVVPAADTVAPVAAWPETLLFAK